MLLGAVELGGTKVNVAIGTGDGTLLAKQRLDTRDPATTVGAIAAFFAGAASTHGRISAMGVGAFGPIALDPRDPAFGTIGATNKPGWSGYDLVNALIERVGVPLAIDTDVAAAGLGEYHHGALKGIGCGAYLTVGTGIGAAILIEGRPITGRMHPEIGHLPVHRDPGDDFPSLCSFHESCAEGLASGPAIGARFGQPLNAFQPGGGEHRLVASYLGQLCASIVLAVSPHRIVLGGGVSNVPELHTAVRTQMYRHLNGYALAGMPDESFIVGPSLGDDAGLRGCLVLAETANPVEPAERLRHQPAEFADVD